MNQERSEAVASTLADIGYEGIVAFDRTEPEYSTLERLYDEYDSEAHVKLLGILAGSQDYQLNGDAQRFWNELERTALDYRALDSTQAVRDILGNFMETDVNARLNNQKRDRLVRVFEDGFDGWFVENHDTTAPLEVWEQLADGLNNDMNAKTVVLSMKIYDIAHLIKHGEYLTFPREIPIPCDLQVERVSRTAGVTDADETGRILSTWAEVMESTSEKVGRDISLLRIDSIVWQAGQIIGENEPDHGAARAALSEHFDSVGLEEGEAQRLAEELTVEM